MIERSHKTEEGRKVVQLAEMSDLQRIQADVEALKVMGISEAQQQIILKPVFAKIAKLLARINEVAKGFCKVVYTIDELKSKFPGKTAINKLNATQVYELGKNLDLAVSPDNNKPKNKKVVVQHFEQKVWS